MQVLILFFVFLFIGTSCNNKIKKEHNTVSRKEISSSEFTNENKIFNNYRVKVIEKIPHDEYAYTQGLLYHKGYLYESTGQRGQSTLRKIDPKSGEVIKIKNIPANFFAEGIEIFDNKIYLLTWTSGKCLVFDVNTFKKVDEFVYQGEGWGLTSFGDKLLMSDGSNILRVVNPDDFSIERNLTVVDQNYNPLGYLNELENINGDIWANVWMKDIIAIIDPQTGMLKAWVDISDLRQLFVRSQSQEASNGIAYNKEENIIYITGKNWDYIFIVELVE